MHHIRDCRRQQVSVNFNHEQSFAQYNTYAWGSNNANEIKDSILAQVAKQDIDAAMQAKGLQSSHRRHLSKSRKRRTAC